MLQSMRSNMGSRRLVMLLLMVAILLAGLMISLRSASMGDKRHSQLSSESAAAVAAQAGGDSRAEKSGAQGYARVLFMGSGSSHSIAPSPAQ